LTFRVVIGSEMTESNGDTPVDPAVLPDILTHGQSVSRYQKGQMLFSQGDPADAVFYLKEGKIKIVVVSGKGREAVIATQEPGAFLGEGCLTSQSQRVSSAIAMTGCEIVRIERSTMIRALHECPAISQMFIAHLLKRTIRTEDDLVDQLFHSSEKRLARALILLANLSKEGQTHAIIARLSQETLAEMIGTTRSRVNVFMEKFRKSGFIEYTYGHVKINASLMDFALQESHEIKDE
jgi:CRP/FNR family cyclic AMP-dependent transcriptional regulator